MTLEDIARIHWWHRTARRMQVQATEVLLGDSDARGRKAARDIDDAWEKARDREVKAMKAALGSITLLNMVGVHD